MRVWTKYELEQFDGVFNACMSSALGYDRYKPIQLNQIRHGTPTKEMPNGNELPKAHRDLIIKVGGLEKFASLFTPNNKSTTMPRLINYLANERIQPKEFELLGPVWIAKEYAYRNVEIKFEAKGV